MWDGMQETYQKFKANPPARIKRKAEKQRQEREIEEKRRRLNQERAAQGALTTSCSSWKRRGIVIITIDAQIGIGIGIPPL